MDTENHNIPQNKSPWEPVSEQENIKYNQQIAEGSVWTRIRDKTPGGLGHRGALKLY